MTPRTERFDLVVHATHEAGLKVGGIGAVLQGLLSAKTYNEHVARTILVGPMNTEDKTEMERLTSPRNQLDIHYSSHHGVNRLDTELQTKLERIERDYGVKLLYGTRTFGPAHHQVILVDGSHADRDRTNAFKGLLYHHFGIQSDRYESNPEYRLHVHAAEPGFQALQAIAGPVRGRRFIIAHEFMGMPLCYSAMIHDPGAYRTVFYGHEVATVRPIVESHSGHDTMFYNVLEQAQRSGRYLEDIFGDQSAFFKDALIRPAAIHCDNIFAVGDSVVREMRFLDARWNQANIDLVYNGIPSYQIDRDQKETSHARLQQYCANLLGYVPDYVFTHVTRFIPSKGLWRDIRVMEQLDPLLAQQAKNAVLYVLSTIIPIGRPAEAILAMEAQYGWPVAHRESSIRVQGREVPDLISHEIPFYHAIEQFNGQARASKIVLINQFGWSQDRCGRRMPEDMAFVDIRQGSDLEFGQSVYEPFGIAQVEPLSFGALCVVSNVCGCVGFVRRAGGLDKPNVIVADYTRAGELGQSISAALAIDQARRNQIESAQAGAVAQQIIERLPQDAGSAQRLLQDGFALSTKMSWEVVVREYLLPGLARTSSAHTPTSGSSTGSER
jgi:glycosyltransferase involved in cell wall biosynthesis